MNILQSSKDASTQSSKHYKFADTSIRKGNMHKVSVMHDPVKSLPII